MQRLANPAAVPSKEEGGEVRETLKAGEEGEDEVGMAWRDAEMLERVVEEIERSVVVIPEARVLLVVFRLPRTPVAKRTTTINTITTIRDAIPMLTLRRVFDCSCD